MRLFQSLIFLSLSSFALGQGVYIPPRNIKPQPTIVSMTIGDNIVPLIEIGPNGVTLVSFPGNVVTAIIDNDAYRWTETAPKKQTGEEGQTFSRIAFSLSKDLTPQQTDFISRKYISVVMIYKYHGKEYVHDIDLIYRPSSRRSHVVLIPSSADIPYKGNIIDQFRGKFDVIDGTYEHEQNNYRVKQASVGKVETFKQNGFLAPKGAH